MRKPNGKNGLMEYFKNPAAHLHWWFASIALIAGLCFIVLIPPMQGSDETNHFLRVYQISEGDLVSDYVGKSRGGIASRIEDYDHNVGGSLPSGIVDFTFDGLGGIPQDTTNKITAAEFRQLASIKTGSEREAAAFGNTVAYSPLSYAPQVLAVEAGKLLDARPIVLFYLARIAALIFGVVVLALAIRLMPFGKLPMTIILLLPTTVGQLSIVTADTVIISMAFLTVALTLNYSYRKQNISTKEMALIIGLSALVGFIKPTFLVLVLTTLVLLRNKYIPRRKALITAAGSIAATAVCALAWNILVKDMVILGYHMTYPGNDYTAQLNFILHNPLSYLHVLANTVFTGNFNYVPIDLIGYLGWADTPLPILGVAYGFILIGLSLFIAAQHEKVVIPRYVKAIAGACLLGVLLLSSLTMYLFVNSPMDASIAGVQGRYLTPALVLLPLLFLGGKGYLPAASYNTYVRRCMYAAAGLLIFMICVTASRFQDLAAIF